MPFSLNLGGRLAEYDRPLVMGIINVTPDSFYASSRVASDAELAGRVESMVLSGADMLDVGAASSRRGAAEVPEAEEASRLAKALATIRRVAPDIPVSVDTYRASVARMAVERHGADMVNDISGGDMDADMFQTVADLHIPYVLMHMRGTPATMQQMTGYDDVTAGVITELSGKVRRLALMGVADIIIDPGFGFAKTTEQNFSLMRHLPQIADAFHRPLLVGISRKTMIWSSLSIGASEALNGTTALNTIALMQGASILRVHDVEACRQAVTLVGLTFPDSYEIRN